MYHWTSSSSVDAKKESYSSFADLGGLDIKCFQELYLDTSTLSSPSVSPTSTDTPTSPLSTAEVAELGADAYQASEQQQSQSQADTQPQQQQKQRQYFNSLPRRSVGGGAGYSQQRYIQQQQLRHQQHQHQHVASSAASAQHQQQKQQQQNNEISKSLKTLAMLSAYRTGNDGAQTSTPPVDAIMQDFASNGFSSDDYYNCQQYQSPLMQYNQQQLNNSNNIGSLINLNSLTGLLQNNAAAVATMNQSAINSHLTEMRKNFWMMHLPTQSYIPNAGQFAQSPQATMAAAAAAAAATAAAAANIDYNTQFNASSSSSSSSNGSSVNNNNGTGNFGNKKLQKRFGNKSDKFSTVKHCVFCENNNEPEAVVKSHAVRDSLGRVLCPKLRTYICPICKASGDMAHTVKYCPQKPIITMEDALKAETFRLAKSNYYKQQMQV